MRVTSRRIQALPKATTVVSSVMFAFLTIIAFPAITQAEENPEAESPSQVVAGVESPSAPSASYQAGSNDIVWTWITPNGGLAPDAGDVGGDPENPITEYPTDIVQFGYEFSKQGGAATPGMVTSDILTLTTPAFEDGEYVLKIWSITRAGEVSAPVSGTVMFAAPIPEVSELPPIEIPAPVDISPVTNKPVSGGTTTLLGGSSPVVNQDSPGYMTGNAISNALSPTSADKAVAGVTTAGVVKPSSQGWVVLGLAWYVWLIILVIGFFVTRQVLRTLKNT